MPAWKRIVVDSLEKKDESSIDSVEVAMRIAECYPASTIWFSYSDAMEEIKNRETHEVIPLIVKEEVMASTLVESRFKDMGIGDFNVKAHVGGEYHG